MPLYNWRKAVKAPAAVVYREVVGEKEEIKTREGTLYAYADQDYIIRGVEGEEYPIKRQIFEATYITPHSAAAFKDGAFGFRWLDHQLRQRFSRLFEEVFPLLCADDFPGKPSLHSFFQLLFSEEHGHIAALNEIMGSNDWPEVKDRALTVCLLAGLIAMKAQWRGGWSE